MRKLDAHFVRALEDTSINTFTFCIRLNTYEPTPTQIQDLKDLGCNHPVGPVCTAHELSRDVIEKIQALDFVIYLTLSQTLHME